MAQTYTKERLIEKLKEIRAKGWIENARPENAGGIGNTIEDILGIKENNLPIPNAAEWELKCQRIGLKELEPQPYWGFDDLFHKAGTKLLNCFFLQAKVKKEGKKEYFCYEKILMLKKFDLGKFIKAIEDGIILVDFDARTGHNHGTKFRMRQDRLPALYDTVETI